MKALYAATALALLSSAAHAGTAASATGGKATAGPATTTDASPLFTGSATAGFDSAYYFRGLWFSNNNLYGGVNLSAPIADKVTLGLGALYTHSLDTSVPEGDLDYSELDLIGSLTYDAGFAKLGLTLTHYQFFDTFSGEVNGQTYGFAASPDSTIKNATDLALSAAIPFGAANLYLTGVHDFKIDGWYFEAGVDYTIALNETVSLVPFAQVGYGVDYYSYEEVTGIDSGLTHVRVGVNAPIKLTPSITLTPYIAANFAQESREMLNVIEDTNHLYFGASLSFAF